MIPILIALLLIAPVAGADVPVRKGWRIYESIGYACDGKCKEYRCIFNESQKEAYCFEDIVQPAEEATPSHMQFHQDFTDDSKYWWKENGVCVKGDCPEEALPHITFKNVTIHATDEAIRKADAEKLLKKCESMLSEAEAFYNELGVKNNDNVDTNAIMATAYCTRYNSELLKEIKEKIK